ncbi:MAG: DUF2093 domain-containing protein [Pseudomonadota bacterium]
MNKFEKFIGLKGEAKVHYMSNDYQIVVPGGFVTCAVTKQPIPLNELKYWDVEQQEPYLNANIALQRYREIEGK